MLTHSALLNDMRIELQQYAPTYSTDNKLASLVPQTTTPNHQKLAQGPMTHPTLCRF